MTLAGIVLLVSTVGCAARATIWVDVHTDLVPGEEVDRLVMRLDDGASSSTRIDRGAPFLEPARRFGPLETSPGLRSVTIELQRGGATVLSRTITGTFSGTVVLTAWLTRACVGVECPTASDPEATECDDGVCIRPDCADTPGGCVAPTCALDADCTGAHAECASNACTSGRCVLVPDDTRCGPGTYCDPEAGCVPRGSADGGPPDAGGELDAPPPPIDAGTDTPPPPPPYRLFHLANGAGAWTETATSGAGPTEPVLAAFASTPYREIVAFTATETFYLRTTDHVWVAREPRTDEFPDIEGSWTLMESETVVAAGPRILYVYVAQGVFLYDWDGATRSATFQQYVERSDFPAVEWGTPLAAPYYSVVGVLGRPDDAAGWVAPEPADRCNASPLGAHTIYLSWDGFGPAAMLVSTYDYACSRFIDREIYSSFAPFSLPGAPDPWTVEAAVGEESGIYLFVTE